VMWFLSAGKAKHEPSKFEAKTRIATFDDLLNYKTAQDESMKIAAVEQPKTAEMEKEIRGGLMRKVDLCANGEMELPFGVMAPFSKQFGLKTLLSTLAGLGIALRPNEFHMLVGMEMPAHGAIAKMAHEAGVTFKTSMPVGMRTDLMVSSANFNTKLAAELLPYLDQRSSFAPHLAVRLGQMSKTASESRVAPRQSMDGRVMAKIAALYNGYRASLLRESDTLFPHYFDVVRPSTADLVKSASGGALLLSSPSVVHWVSAHLEKVADVEDEVVTAVNYVISDRDHTKLAALGVGVCAELNKGGNFISAVKSAVRTAL